MNLSQNGYGSLSFFSQFSSVSSQFYLFIYPSFFCLLHLLLFWTGTELALSATITMSVCVFRLKKQRSVNIQKRSREYIQNGSMCAVMAIRPRVMTRAF